MSETPKTNNIKTQKHFRSLTVTVTLIFLTLNLVILFLSTSLGLLFDFQAQQKIIINQQQTFVKTAAHTVTHSLEEKLTSLDQAADVNNLAVSSDRRELVMSKTLGRDASFRQLILIDAKGQELKRISRLSTSMPSSVERFKESILTEVLKGEQYISPVYIDETTSEPFVLIAVPANDMFREPQGAFIAEVDLKFMWDLVGEIKVGQHGLVYVVDKEGNLIAFKDTSRVLKGENLSTLSEVKEFLNSNDTIDENTAAIGKGIQDTLVVSTYTPLNFPDWAVVVEMPIFEAYQAIITQVEMMLVVILLLSMVTMVIVRYLSKSITAPLIILQDAAEKLSSGSLDGKVDIHTGNEIETLADAFNGMAERISHYTGDLEAEVKERTGEISTQIAEYEKLNKFMVGREVRMAELKKEIEELKKKIESKQI